MVVEPGHWKHQKRLGGNWIRLGRHNDFRILEKMMRYLNEFADQVVVYKVARNFGLMGWRLPI